MNGGVFVGLVFLALLLLGMWVFRKRVRRNRWTRANAWRPRWCHPSFWNNDNRGHTQSR
jgi:hypothetical protein